MSTKIILFILFTGLFTGCSTPRSIMQSWVGHTETELRKSWGEPVKVIDNGNDSKILVYLGATDDSTGSKKEFCDCKFTSNCITPRIREYRMMKNFYVTRMGNIYACKIEKLK